MSASVTAVSDPAPLISKIENPVNLEAEGKLNLTYSARLRGDKLQVGGEGSGVFFVPCLESGEADSNEEHWVKVQDEHLTHNTKTMLEFYLPRTLDTTKKYFIALRTSIRGKTELKNAVTGISRIPVTIEE